MSNYRHLIDLDDFSLSDIDKILTLGKKIKEKPFLYGERCKGKIMGTLFYEPSTRTQMSFQTAMLRLGGTIIGFDNPSTSSVAKGENLQDTTKVVSLYSDIMVMRHPLEGAAKAAALTAECPVINAGDGGHLHPTQTLTDLLTLRLEKGRLDNLTIGLCGDLRNGRTVHSLLKALSKYENNKFILISTKELALPSYIKDILKARGCHFEEVSTIEEAIGTLDMLYMTRIQKERFANPDEYERLKDVYILDTAKMKKAPENMIVMHPLPRVDEIEMAVDRDSRAKYFVQAENGVYVRMALIICMLENLLSDSKLISGYTNPDVQCRNEKCISNNETYLPHAFKASGDILECEFCDERLLLQ